MRLKFDANQDFQLQSVNAVTSLFIGQPRIAPDPELIVIQKRIDTATGIKDVRFYNFFDKDP